MLSTMLQLGSTGRVFYEDSATSILCDSLPGNEPRPGENSISVDCYRTATYRHGETATRKYAAFSFTLDSNGKISDFTVAAGTALKEQVTPQKINGKYFLVFQNGLNVGNSLSPFSYCQACCFRSPPQ